MGYDPAIVVISVLAHSDQRLNDTANNILTTKEFVINFVSVQLAEAMNITWIDTPPGTNDLELANLTTSPSTKVGLPRVI